MSCPLGHGHGHGPSHGASGEKVWEIPDPEYKCTFHNSVKGPSPHVTYRQNAVKPIYNNIIEVIGNTPLVRINKVQAEDGVQAEFLAKCEFLNPAGSLKDRIGFRMIYDAEKQGKIKPGDTLVEPTAGNTGMGLALAASVMGYKCIFTLPDKMSNEKVDALSALGATIVRAPTELDHDHPDSYYHKAKQIAAQPNHFMLDQYINPSNPIAHYESTAEELLVQCEGKIDYIFISAGTGGCLTGVGRKIKEKLPSCKIVAVDPEGSLQALPGTLNGPPGSYKVEGPGHDYIPMVMDRKVADYWVKTNDIESFTYARKAIRQEGLLCGGTSGAVLLGAIKFAKEHNLPAGARCVLILPDNIRNYLSKFVSTGWMVDNQFLPLDTYKDPVHPFHDIPASKLPLQSIPLHDDSLTVKEALKQLTGGVEIIVFQRGGSVAKTLTLGSITAALCSGMAKLEDKAIFVAKREYVLHPISIDCAQLERVLRRTGSCLLQEVNEKKEIVKLYYVREKDLSGLLREKYGIA